MELERLSRRDFLKLTLAGFFTLARPGQAGFRPAAAKMDLGGATSSLAATETQGRVAKASIDLYDAPSAKAKSLKSLYQDAVYPISAVTLGDDSVAYNRVWYNLNGEGFAHSGGVQPVKVQANEISTAIPEGGQLAEISVPFTDAMWWPDGSQAVAYRLYYGTTHWVTRLDTDSSGKTWYEVYDDKIKDTYFLKPAHVRLIGPGQLQPISPAVDPADKRIEVRLAEQILIAYEKDQPVFYARTATGGSFSNGNFSTPPGRHHTRTKRPSRHMAAGDRAAANSYDLPGVPWVSYFTKEGLAIHGTYWHNDFGKPRSHGCINLSSAAARWVYLWTIPTVLPDETIAYDVDGTPVDVVDTTI